MADLRRVTLVTHKKKRHFWNKTQDIRDIFGLASSSPRNAASVYTTYGCDINRHRYYDWIARGARLENGADAARYDIKASWLFGAKICKCLQGKGASSSCVKASVV